MKMLAVFHDGGAGILARFLKPGFRHTFCALDMNGYWVVIDGREGLPYPEVVAAADFNLAEFYRDEGYTVVELDQLRSPSWFPIMYDDCLGMTKKMLGVQDFFIRTPYQLYRKLRGFI